MDSVNDQMYVEKYRPQSLDDVIGQEEAVKQLKEWTDDPSTPHMLFSGPAGTGKTSVILAFAKDKYGEGWKNNIMSLNASDERGIDVIRNKVKSFARQSTAVGSNANHQYIHLDEMDSLTDSAQPALRRVMEKFSDQTKFVMTCNYQNQIIDPLLSRCAVFNFGKLDDSEVKQFLDRVVEGESLDVDENHLWDLVEHSRGDARKAVNTLQAAEADGTVSAQSIDALVSVVDDDLIEELVDMAIAGDYGEAMDKTDKVLKSGVDSQTLCDSMLRVVKDKNWPAPIRAKAISKIGKADWRILNGANPNVQFHSLLSSIHVARHLNVDNYEQEQWEDDGH